MGSGVPKYPRRHERRCLVGGLEHVFPYIIYIYLYLYGNNTPNRLICFRGVETTNQMWILGSEVSMNLLQLMEVERVKPSWELIQWGLQCLLSSQVHCDLWDDSAEHAHWPGLSEKKHRKPGGWWWRTRTKLVLLWEWKWNKNINLFYFILHLKLPFWSPSKMHTQFWGFAAAQHFWPSGQASQRSFSQSIDIYR